MTDHSLVGQLSVERSSVYIGHSGNARGCLSVDRVGAVLERSLVDVRCFRHSLAGLDFHLISGRRG
jgi:hypothetical protein